MAGRRVEVTPMSNRTANIKALDVRDVASSGSGRREAIMLTAGLRAADARTDGIVGEVGLGIDARIFDDAPPPVARRNWYLPLKCGGEWLTALTLLVLASPLVVVLA